MLSKKEFRKVAAEYEALDAQIKALEAAREAAKNEMVAEMDRRGVSEMDVGGKVVRWTKFYQSRFDSAGFKKACPDVYAGWQKEVVGHRFSIG